MKKEDNVVDIDFIGFFFGCKPEDEIKDVFTSFISNVYDDAKPKNMTLLILHVFHYLSLIEKNSKKYSLGKFKQSNKFIFAYFFYMATYKVLDIEEDMDDRYNSCKNDMDFLKIITTRDSDILNYYLFSRFKLIQNISVDDNEEKNKIMIDLQSCAKELIGNKTVYNKIPKNVKKLYANAFEEVVK